MAPMAQAHIQITNGQEKTVGQYVQLYTHKHNIGKYI